MMNHGHLTRQIAAHQLHIANLTAVISRIRQANITVDVFEKEDSMGHTYARYTIAPEVVRDMMNQGRVLRNPSTSNLFVMS